MDGELWAVIQAHLDRYGVREATFARRIGSSPQTINTWKVRGLKRLPERWLLEGVARETGTPYGVVLNAALIDIGYLGSGGATEPPPLDPPPERPRNGAHPAVPAAGDTRQVPSRPAHEPGRTRAQRAGHTRSHGSR